MFPPRQFLTIKAVPPNLAEPIEPLGLTIAEVVSTHPIPDALAARLHMPKKCLGELQKLWRDPPLECDYEGEPEKFSLRIGLHESRHGFVDVEVHWSEKAGKLDLGVHLYNDDEDPEKKTETLWASQQMQTATAQEIEKLEQIWIAVEPVAQIVLTSIEIRPNAKCPCGSGKKHKKCCGRLR
jgi:SEC-C motif